MAHAGTMDLGRNAQAKPSGNPWPLIGLAVAAVAIIAAVWFASSAGLVGGQLAAKPADRTYDAIEAQRGAVSLSGKSADDVVLGRDDSNDTIDFRGRFAGSTPVCRAISPTSGLTVNVGCSPSTTAAASQYAASGGWYGQHYSVPPIYIAPAGRLMVQPALEFKAALVLAAAKADAQQIVARYPFMVAQAASSTSGTFHVGNPAGENSVKRDRVGGP